MNKPDLKAQFYALAAEAFCNQETKKKEILMQYGSVEAFHEKLSLNFINRHNMPDFDGLYKFYTTFFTLPEETESKEGFEATLALNTHETFLNKYGFYEEAWMYLCLPDTKEIIAGLNFSVYKLPDEGLTASNEYGGTVHVIYIFVKTAYRGLRVAVRLLGELENYTRSLTGNNKELLYICEQNAPEKMTYHEYFSDNISALIDQCDRLKWWDKLGYKRLDFPYIQPPLNQGQEACTNLTLNARAPGKEKLPADLIAFHLERFFKLAVYKGLEERVDSYYNEQMAWLKNNRYVDLWGNSKLYEELKQRFYKD